MGGDHKCPLCSATFTRPQHVGRHLRAHTGDRPYECKECPLRFARSDLLSRHVNKAHPKPNGANDGNKNDKKGRSKSMSSGTNMPPRPLPMGKGGVVPPPGGVGHRPETTAFQAQRMYPNHPLLQHQNAPGATWPPHDIWRMGVPGVANFNIGLAGPHPGGAVGGGGVGAMGPAVGHIHPAIGPDVIGPLGNAPAPGLAFMADHAVAAAAVAAATANATANATASMPSLSYPASDPGLAGPSPYDISASLPNLSTSPMATVGYELNVKKRACDQCNHSKVRCDFADPCARCTHRHVQCTYMKPPRNTRGRNVTYPVPNITGAPFSASPRSQSLSAPDPSAVNVNSPIALGLQLQHDAAAMARRASEQSSASSDIFGSDRVRPPVPDTLWDTPPTQPRSQSTATTNSSATGMILQSPKSGHSLLFGSSLPGDANAGEVERERSLSDVGANSSGSWGLPANQEPAIQFVNSFVSQQGCDAQGAIPANAQNIWAGQGGLYSAMLSNESALSLTQDDLSDSNTVPGSMDDHVSPRRRSSSAGMWANALKEMRIDDTCVPPILDPALEQLPLNDMQRTLSNSDLALWKLFLDPGALGTPERLSSLDFVHDPARGLSKSSSAPDLTTPAAVANHPNPMEMLGSPQRELDMSQLEERRRASTNAVEDDGVMSKWKNQIQQRHASFNMDPDAAANVRTRALTNARFASSATHLHLERPLLHPLVRTSAGNETLAPERLPSFGPTSLDHMTPGGPQRGGAMTPPVPSRFLHMVTASDVRPGNKRQASQTLVGDTQKRGTFLIWPDDEGDVASVPSSRRSSGPVHGIPNKPASHDLPKQPADASMVTAPKA